MTDLQPPPLSDLAVLEARFQESFAVGRPVGLEVIGYGEISSVVRWEGDSGPVAAKRLPNYRSEASRAAHRDLMVEYIEALGERDVDVLPTDFLEAGGSDGSFVLYMVQALVGADRLAVDILRGASPEEGEILLRQIVGLTAATLGEPWLGLDVQLSNWVVVDGKLWYLDISTPFIRDLTTGLSRLETSVFVASLPWLLRWPVQRFMAEDIVGEYFDLRITLMNAIANLSKERLAGWMEVAIDIANEVVDEPISLDEVHRYYGKDQRLWAVLQWLRRADRWWQLNVRKRPYPVLLPGRIDR